MDTIKTSNTLIKSLVVIFYTSAIVVQLLVILKVIPYDWVNGGMSKSYEIQAIQSIISLVIIIGLLVFVLKIIKQGTLINNWKLKILYLITFFWLLGLVMQLAGTTFERYFLSFVLLLGVASHALLIRQIKASKSSRPVS